MKNPTFLVSVMSLAAVLAFPLSDSTKRQNQQNLTIIIDVVHYAAGSLQDVTRSQFATSLVAALWNIDPHYNYVACHSPHSYGFEGQQGVDWDHIWTRYDGKASTPGYDVVVGGAGLFVLQGDGGYDNWAYKGYVASDQQVGEARLVTFTAPP